MPRGGRRIGAGRKFGSTNRFSQQLLEKAKASGELPLDYLLSVMRNEEMDTRLRINAAKAAAPYLHHKLSSVSFNLLDADSTQLDHEDWLLNLEQNV